MKHWTIAASAGDYLAMHNLLLCLKNDTSVENQSTQH